MSIDPQRIKRFAEVSMVIMLLLGAVTLGLAPFTGSYRGFYLSVFLGGVIVFTSIIYLLLMVMRKAEDVKGIATPAIQCLWISTSMSLGYVVTALAPYFSISFTIAVTLFVIGWLMLIYGLYALLKISKETKVPLAV
ncbi:hypothetical protein DSO06_03410 [Candidatus Nezhaarchaeota archaeon WYZ-LMO8]|nr:MAG: hypothetical protein DSO06_03410 [Candidatus Nezhaarchaeota archaeon WYZ-LMO8]